MIKKPLIAACILIAIISISAMSCAGAPRFTSTDTALLVIDIQNAYLPVYNQGTFIPNVKSLIDEARENGVPVVFVRNLDGYNREGSFGWKFHGSVRPAEGENVIEKEYPSSFSDTELKAVLEELGATTLVLTGLASSGCYGATVRDAHRLEYKTVVVSDAHADQTKGRADSLNNVLANYENILIMKTEEIRFKTD